MENTDSRSLSSEIQQHNRNLAINLFKKGVERKEIAKIIGIHYGVACRWIRAWEKGDRKAKAIQLGKRGRNKGDNCLLSADQERCLKRLLVEKNPKQLKLPFALWTRKAIQSVVYQMWRVRMAIRTVGDYLKRWGFTPQKPIRKAYEQSPKAVQEWLDVTYPKIKSRAAAEKAEIYWGDETGVRNDCQHSRGYAPRGKTPVVAINAKRFSLNMISAINNKGLLRFMMYESTMTARVLLKFMKRLIKDADRKVFLVLDNLKVHHAILVRRWLEKDKNKEKIEVFYLPSYSPELNPDEYLNCDLKSGIRRAAPSRSSEDLKKTVSSHMRMLQKKSERVAKYFEHPSIRYAA
ncbi:IS630 family transposase [Desulfopila aestuarii]|uniref:Transposase n=1 Tax=Desulfopila aestuarii DSM 18488 TaxID=1121416 RepID=A0A1M7YJJ5_9BACT|nr:IS630 family transposase [Desulfopila aestuarii]SHO52793.1 Transposase [Desulfopila aestuarii DSM 18488]